jgi:dTDP-4-amino-4,6-dideoxygalactose transaminase
MSTSEKYKLEIATYLNASPDQLFLYWKGRIGLYAILKSMGVQEGDEVILPAFTCVVVPNAIIYLGAKPIYVDIDPHSLNTNLANIKGRVSASTKCIIIQNTFGLSSEVDEIVAYAKEHNIYTIEDCTHGFGGAYNGKPNGSYCDAAFYSTQWNKPYSTGIGGFSFVRNDMLLKGMKEIDRTLVAPSKKQKWMLGSLMKIKKYMLHDSTYWPMLRIYRKLSKSGKVVGSSTGAEITSSKMPDDYLTASSAIQERVGINALKQLKAVIAERRINGAAYNEFLKTENKFHYSENDVLNHSFLKYPIFVKNRDAFMRKAEKSKIRLGDWFISPIHPVLSNFEEWKMNPKDYPIANNSTQHIVNLPTEAIKKQRILKFLKDNLEDLL